MTLYDSVPVPVRAAETLSPETVANLAPRLAEIVQRTDGEAVAAPDADALRSRLRPGGAFLFDVPDEVVPIWGFGDEVLWADGEPTVIVGPPGVGKTTLVGQLMFARMGLLTSVLDWSVAEGRRVLYLASDRPRQAQRALRRLARPEWRQALDERLVVWPGPPPTDVADRPEILLELAREADADTVVVDSLKDMTADLSDGPTASLLNRAMQLIVADDRQVVALHHLRKSADGRKPRSLDEVYGSTWLTAGAGSVLLMWGRAGDPVVELVHLKQPVAEVGPLKIEHNHEAGTTSIHRGIDLRILLPNRGPTGITAPDFARLLFETQVPDENMTRRARRRLDRAVAEGWADKCDPSLGGAGGSAAAVYRAKAVDG